MIICHEVFLYKYKKKGQTENEISFGGLSGFEKSVHFARNVNTCKQDLSYHTVQTTIWNIISVILSSSCGHRKIVTG